MARPKKQAKIKEPIRLRAKALANGNKSLYLDMYQNGRREYHFLRLYLIPETDLTAKIANQNTLKAANAIKAQKIIELTNRKAGLSSAPTRSKIKLVDWIEQYADIVRNDHPDSAYRFRFVSLVNHIKIYSPDITLGRIDKEYCEGLIEYFKNAETIKRNKLANSTIGTYIILFNTVINAALHEDMISENPMHKIDSKRKPKAERSLREYLTIDELKKLTNAPSRMPDIKRAFLFCCFCGLRVSDVQALTWRNIVVDNGQAVARIVVKKTRQPLHVPLSPEALKWLPERGKATDDSKIFNIGKYSNIRVHLQKWIESVGIKKRVTFHVARHTFATLMLTLGADIYTTSKLLGHSKITTTQI